RRRCREHVSHVGDVYPDDAGTDRYIWTDATCPPWADHHVPIRGGDATRLNEADVALEECRKQRHFALDAEPAVPLPAGRRADRDFAQRFSAVQVDETCLRASRGARKRCDEPVRRGCGSTVTDQDERDDSARGELHSAPRMMVRNAAANGDTRTS